MYKTYYRTTERLPRNTAKEKFFRSFARGMLLFLLLLILAGVGAEAYAADAAQSEPPKNMLWPVVGIIFLGAAIYYCEWKYPCQQWREQHSLVDLTMDPEIKPFVPLAKESEPAEQKGPTILLSKTDALYPAYRTRACDDPNFVERRKHSRDTTTSEAHKDDHAVLMFSFSMKDRLAAARDARENSDHHNTAAVSVEDLEIALVIAMRRGNIIDIANHCMFLHSRGVRNIKTGVRT